MTNSFSTHERISFACWRVLALLAFAIFINFVDRGNLAIAAPLLKDELHLSASQLGVLLSSFFWTYSLCAIPAGALVDRFNPGWVLAAGFSLWSCATSASGLVHSFAALLACRLMLGVTEAVAFPAYATILARHFRESQRGLANSVGSIAQAAGPAAATFAGGILIARLGWRPFFILLGLISLLWLIPWLRWMPQNTSGDLATPKLAREGILKVLRQPSAWGMCTGLFCGNYVLYLLLTWLPFYLVHERHFSLTTTAKIGGVAFLCKAFAALASGWVSDVWIAGGATPTLARKTLLCLGMVFSGGFLLLASVSTDRSCVILLIFGSAALGLCTPQAHAISQSLAGPQLAGTWMSLVLFVGNFSGILGPAITGFVVDRSGHFFWAFALAAAIAWLGAISYALLVGPVRPIEWSKSVPSRRLHTASS